MRLTTSPPSCAERHEIWEHKTPGTLWGHTGPVTVLFYLTFTIPFLPPILFLHSTIFLYPYSIFPIQCLALLPLHVFTYIYFFILYLMVTSMNGMSQNKARCVSLCAGRISPHFGLHRQNKACNAMIIMYKLYTNIV